MIILSVVRKKPPEWFLNQMSPFNFRYEICRHNPFHVRNKMLQQAIDDGHDKALFVDDDIRFKPEHVKMLLDRNLDIVGGSYLTRRAENAVCAVKDNCWVEPTETGLLEVDRIGCAFLLLGLKFIAQLSKPWFRHEFFVDEHGERGQTSADFGLCLHARTSGFKVYLDCDCIVEHLTEEGEMAEQGKNIDTAILEIQMIVSDGLKLLRGEIVARQMEINKLAEENANLRKQLAVRPAPGPASISFAQSDDQLDNADHEA